MKLGDLVRSYNGDWFFEGTITAIEDEAVRVDFFDWIAAYNPKDLRLSHIHYAEVWVTHVMGEIIKDYRI